MYSQGALRRKLHLGIDAGSRAVAEPVPDHLGEMAHELVVVLEPIGLGADDRAVVRNADEEVAPFRVEKGGDGLGTAWDTPLSSCRSSLRLQRSVDLNSRVFDSPFLISSSAFRCVRRY
jgi:hypothetical protein